MTILGPERTAPSRLNLSQAVNSFGTTIGPAIGGWLIFRVFNHPNAHGADAVKVPYLCFTGVFVLLAVFFRFAHLPDFANAETIGKGAGALRYPHTVLGMVAIFMYVGGEVAVGSAIVNFFGTARLGGMSTVMASRYLSFYWGGLMIGRFMGALALSKIKPYKHALIVAVPVAAFVVIAALAGLPDAIHYAPFLIVLVIAFFIGESSANRMLALFGVIIVALLTAVMSSSGSVAQ